MKATAESRALRATTLRVLLLAAMGLGMASAQVNEDKKRTRVPAAVMSFRGAPWLERETRQEEEKPYEVLKAMGLKDGDVVADIGVGSGYYARKIAKAVAPTGKVYGVDIQEEMLDYLMEFCEKEEIDNVVPLLGDVEDPHLPPGTIDWIILADVYHEFENPEAMLAKMREALKPTGKVALLEYRLENDTGAHIKLEHRMSVKQVLSEWNPAGFELIDLLEFLPSQHLFIFHKRPGRSK